MNSVPHNSRLALYPQPLLDNIPSLFAQIPSVSHSKPMFEYLLNLLQRQTRHLRIEKVYQNVPNTTDARIEPKCSRRGHTLHHGQKRTGYNDIASPARAGDSHSAHRADLQREEIRAHPCRVADRDAIEKHEPDNEHQDDNRRRRDTVALQIESI